MKKDEIIIKKRIKPETLSIVLVSLIFVFSILISIGYSAINASLMISGDLEYKAQALYDIIAKSSKGLDTNIDFSVVPTEATSGVYKMNSTNSDKYPVYYYRGIVSNNNVKFAGFCWKIVRTTDTGGIKLIYNGTPNNGSCNNTGDASSIGKSAFNSDPNDNDAQDAKYVGYTYDTNTDSTIKTYIDDWYSKNMTSYTGVLEDTIWCNDRSVSSTSGSAINYGAYGRLESYKPSIICPNTSDKYTVSSSKGNGLLKYPVALLTADEAMLSGGGWGSYTSNLYLDTNKRSWLLSPYDFSTFAAGFIFFRNGALHFYSGVAYDESVRPAVSLKSGTKISGGDGSYSNPYQVLTN